MCWRFGTKRKKDPIKWIDPLGEMPKEWLNLVNVAYLGGAIDKDQVFAAVSLLNVLDIATSGVRDLLGNISASGVGKLMLIGKHCTGSSICWQNSRPER